MFRFPELSSIPTNQTDQDDSSSNLTAEYPLESLFYNQLNPLTHRSGDRPPSDLSHEEFNSEGANLPNGVPKSSQVQRRKNSEVRIINFIQKQKQLRNRNRRMGLQVTLTHRDSAFRNVEDGIEGSLAGFITQEANDTIKLLHENALMNARDFQTSFEDVLLKRKSAPRNLKIDLDQKLSTRRQSERFKKRFMEMKTEHSRLLRLTLNSLLGFQEFSKFMALFFKHKFDSVFGVFELLKELDSLFVWKVLDCVSGKGSRRKRNQFWQMPNVRRRRKLLRRLPVRLPGSRAR